MKVIHTYIAAVSLLAFSNAAQAQATSSPATRNITTPKPATPVWETERDLLVLFENAADRIQLARQVMGVCLDINASLTTQQRYDGLKIAGHTLWGAGVLSDAATCFSGIISLGMNADADADAYRMRAQCYFFDSNYQAAANDYEMCYSISMSIASASGDHDLYQLVTPMLIKAASEAQDYQLALDVADDALANTSLLSNIRTEALRAGGEAAVRSGDLVKAQSYLTTLLTEYPSYGLDYPGERVAVELNLIQANGHSLEDFTPNGVDALAAVVQNPDYQGLPAWVTAVSIMAGLLDEADEVAKSNTLRLWAVDMVSQANNALPASDPDTTNKVRMGRLAQLGLLQHASKQYRKVKQYSNQEQVLLRIVNDFSDLDQNAVSAANAELAQVSILLNAP